MMLRVANLEGGMVEVRGELRELSAMVRAGVFVPPSTHTENERTGSGT